MKSSSNLEEIISSSPESSDKKIENFLKKLKSNFHPPTKKKGDPKPITEKNKSGEYGSKDKEVLGVLPEDSIIWAPFPLNYSDNNLIKAVCKKIGAEDHYHLCGDILFTWLEENRDELEELAAEYLSEENQLDAIKKRIANAEAVLKRNQMLLERSLNSQRG